MSCCRFSLDRPRAYDPTGPCVQAHPECIAMAPPQICEGATIAFDNANAIIAAIDDVAALTAADAIAWFDVNCTQPTGCVVPIAVI